LRDNDVQIKRIRIKQIDCDGSTITCVLFFAGEMSLRVIDEFRVLQFVACKVIQPLVQRLWQLL